MKLHLPKLLLTAVLAAVGSFQAFADKYAAIPDTVYEEGNIPTYTTKSGNTAYEGITHFVYNHAEADGRIITNANVEIESGKNIWVGSGVSSAEKATKPTLVQFNGLISGEGTLRLNEYPSSSNNFVIYEFTNANSTFSGTISQQNGYGTHADCQVNLVNVGTAYQNATFDSYSAVPGIFHFTGENTIKRLTGSNARVTSDSTENVLTLNTTTDGEFGGTLGTGSYHTYDISADDTTTFSTAESAAINLVKNGSATQTFTNTANLGTLTVNAGTLNLNGATTISGSLAVNGGTLGVGNTLTLSSTVTGTGTVTNNGTINLAQDQLNHFGCTLYSGAGDYAGSGYATGDLTVFGSDISYSGSGTVNVNGTSYTVTEGVISLGEGATQWNSYYYINSNLAYNATEMGNATAFVVTNAGTLEFNLANEATVSNVISGAGAVTKTGDGTLTLSGANTYSGGTTISAGTLKLGDASALGSGTIKVTGGTLDVNGKALAGKTVTLGTDGILSNTNTNANGNLWANVNQLHALTLEGDAKVNSVSAMGLVNTTGGVTTLNLNGYTLTKSGSSNFALVGTTVEGTGTIAISEGNLLVGHSGAASTLNADGVVVSLSGGYFKLEHADSLATLAGLDGTGGEVNSKGTITLTGSGEYSYSSVISGSGSLIKTGTGTQTLSGTNTYTGGTTISGGTLVAANANALGTGAVSVAEDATLEFNLASEATVSNVISGAGALNITGGGTLTLSGSNSHSGGTTINGGTLKLGNAGALGSGAVTVNSGGTLDVNGQKLTNKTITLSGSAVSAATLANTGSAIETSQQQIQSIIVNGNAEVQADADFAILGSQWGQTSMTFNDNATLTKTGNGTFSMVNTTVSGSGTIAVSAGALNIGCTNSADKNVTAEDVVFTTTSESATLSLVGSANLTAKGVEGTAGTITGTSGTNLILNSADNHSYGGTVSGDLALEKTGSGTQTFSGASSTFASIAVNGGAITLSGENTTVTGAVSLDANSALNVSGGRATLSALNIAGAGITITQTGGVLAITELNALHTSTIQVSNSASLTISGLVIDKDTHQLTQVGDASYSYSMENGNGFRADQTTYLLFDGYAWDSGITVNGFTISTEDTKTYATGTTGTYGTVFYVNSDRHTVTGSDESATATGYHVEAEAELILATSPSETLTAGQALVTTTGAGNLTLSTNAIVASDAISALTGKLTVNNNAVLYSDTTGNHDTLKEMAYDLSSFTSVELDGATIRYLGDSTTLNNVTVGTNGAAIEIKDMGQTSSVFQLAGTTTLTGELNIASKGFTSEGTTGSDSWKYTVGIDKLTGEGTLKMESTATSERETAKVQIADISGFTGKLQATKHSSSAVLALTNLSGTLGVQSIDLEGGAETQLTVNADNSATMNAAISGAGTVTKLGAGSLTLSGAVGTADSALTMISVSAGTLEHTGVSNVTNVSIYGGNLTYGGGIADATVTHTVTGELKSENGSQNSTLSVDANATLNVGSLNNAWGMSIAVDGTVFANEVKLASHSTETVTGGGTLNTGALTVSNWSGYTISVADLDVTGNLEIYQGSTLNLSSTSSVIDGTTSIAAGNTLKFAGGSATMGGAVTNAGTINVAGGTATMNSTVTSTGTVNVATTGGSQLKLGEVATITANGGEQAVMSKVQMNSTGISGTTEDSSMSNAQIALAQMQADASFTIADMTLTNTTITAATLDTRVNLSNVSGDVKLQTGTFGLETATPTVSSGGSELSMEYSINGTPSPSLTLAGGDTKLMIAANPTIDANGAYGNYTLTFNLAVNFDGLSVPSTDAGWEDLVGFEGWLGQLLTDQRATYQAVADSEAAAATAAAEGSPTVSYGYTPAGTGSNVGSLVITISGLNVPEPATATLSLLALAALAARRRRRK